MMSLEKGNDISQNTTNCTLDFKIYGCGGRILKH